jgi:hypothetical protein
MRIDNVAAVLRQALLAATAAKPATGFRAESDPAVAKPPPATVPIMPPATSVAMLVALAANDPVVEQRRKLAADTDRGLSMLERLHRGLAAGEPSAEQLAELADWVESFTPPDDPTLGPVAREIELRVRVELAKHDLRA